MSATIQIRNVPDELHGRLKARAAELGMTLSAYLLSELDEIARKPTLKELMARLAAAGRGKGSVVEELIAERRAEAQRENEDA